MTHPGRTVDHTVKVPARQHDPVTEQVDSHVQTAPHMTPVPGLVHGSPQPAQASSPAMRTPKQQFAALRRSTPVSPTPSTPAATGPAASTKSIIRRLATQITLGPAPTPVTTTTTTTSTTNSTPGPLGDDVTMTPDTGDSHETPIVIDQPGMTITHQPEIVPEETEMTIVPDEGPGPCHPPLPVSDAPMPSSMQHRRR